MMQNVFPGNTLLEGAEAMQALEREFGYAPNEAAGERWTIYRGEYLIVVHPEQKPRVYARNGRGDYNELEPDFSGLFAR
jgi:hypothetical protein